MAEILLVDDDERTRELITEVLGLSGHTVLTASSGPEFFQQLEEHQPELLILDLVMPNMDGLELMRKLLDQNCHTPMFVISGYNYISEEGLQLLSQGLNFKGFIKKPFDVVELQNLISETLQSESSGATPAKPV